MLRQKSYVCDTMGGTLHTYMVSRDMVLPWTILRFDATP